MTRALGLGRLVCHSDAVMNAQPSIDVVSPAFRAALRGHTLAHGLFVGIYER